MAGGESWHIKNNSGRKKEREERLSPKGRSFSHLPPQASPHQTPSSPFHAGESGMRGERHSEEREKKRRYTERGPRNKSVQPSSPGGAQGKGPAGSACPAVGSVGAPTWAPLLTTFLLPKFS